MSTEWQAVEDRVYFISTGGGISLHMFKDGKAKAQMIAAAPEMYAALKDLIQAHSSYRGLNLNDEGAKYRAWQRANAAIDKFEGGDL